MTNLVARLTRVIVLALAIATASATGSSLASTAVFTAPTPSAVTAGYNYDGNPQLPTDANGTPISTVVAGPDGRNLSGSSDPRPQSETATRFAAEDDLNLASVSRTQHILEGDGPGSGGHLWPGAAGKTPFPESWSGTRIMNSISDIATDPTAWQNAVTQGSRTILTGTQDAVDIRVVVDTQTGEIVTGYPTNLPRNP
jgi:filamentous hemagglutinin